MRQDVRRVENQRAVFETGQQPDQKLQTMWLLGLKSYVLFSKCRSRSTPRYNRLYCQLVDLKGPGIQL